MTSKMLKTPEKTRRKLTNSPKKQLTNLSTKTIKTKKKTQKMFRSLQKKEITKTAKIITKKNKSKQTTKMENPFKNKKVI